MADDESERPGPDGGRLPPRPRLVRRASLVSSVLLFGLPPEAADHALDKAERAALERRYGWSIERLVRQAATVTYPLLDRADELRCLLDDPALAGPPGS